MNRSGSTLPNAAGPIPPGPDQGDGSAVVCSLCGAPAGTGALVFLHERFDGAERVVLNIRLCELCGERLEKHLKRAIPKRLMHLRTTATPPTP